MTHIVQSLQDVVGNTPLVRLARFGGDSVEFFAKCEFLNPGGSIKDRIAARLVDAAERAGLLGPGGTIVEATAGNTGMSLAMVAVRRGYRLVTVMTDKMSDEKIALMRAVGARVVVVPYSASLEHPSALIDVARGIAAEIPGAWFADQFANPQNFAAHFEGTGPELWRQMDGRIDAVVAGIGTGGTLSGIAAYIKSMKSETRIVAADPQGSIFAQVLAGQARKPEKYRIEGIGGDFVPGNAHLDLIDEAIAVSDRDAVTTTLELWRTEGLFVGGSSGCIAAAAKVLAQRPKSRGARIVAILPDGGRGYLTTIHDPDWRRRNRLDDDSDREERACTS
jgi:cystathionine beta-synthase